MAPQVIVRVSTFVAVAGLMMQPAFSQGRGGAGGATTGGGAGAPTGSAPPTGTPTGPTTTRPPTTTTNPTQPGNTQNLPQTPIFISGRVMLEDGSAPTESVVIERVCSGVSHSEGYTDSKGYFSIQLGARNTGVMQDASEESGFSGGHTGGMGGFGGGGLGQTTS